MNAGIVGKFGMEGCGHYFSLPDGDWVFAFRGDNLNRRTNALDFWGADENHLEWRARPMTRNEFSFPDGAIDLATVGVAADANVDGAEAGLLGVYDFGCEQDRSGAGAEGRLHANELLQFLETFFP